jgi:hypothetical protein
MFSPDCLVEELHQVIRLLLKLLAIGYEISLNTVDVFLQQLEILRKCIDRYYVDFEIRETLSRS